MNTVSVMDWKKGSEVLVGDIYLEFEGQFRN